MNKIISKEHFSEKVFKLVIEAPLIAKSRKAGHFVIVLGGLLKIRPIVSIESVIKALHKTLPERHHHLIPMNE